MLSLRIIFSATVMVTGNQAFAQEGSAYSDRQFVWIKEGVALTIGQQVEYKTINAKRFKKGQLLSFTDSTLVFQYSGDINIIHHDELDEVRIFTVTKNKNTKVLFGLAIVAVGGLIFILSNISSGSSKAPPPISGPTSGDIAAGLIMVGGLTYIIVSVIAKPEPLTIQLHASK